MNELRSGARKTRRTRLWLFALMLAFAAGEAAAENRGHPVSVTQSLVYLTREQATVKIEIFLEDLFLFHDLKPNDANFLDPATIKRGIELHKTFVAERFEIRDVAGRRLEPVDEPNVVAKFPDEGVALAELMAHRLTFEMRYPLNQIPEFLTFKQRFTDEEAILPSEMRLQIKQEGGGEPINEVLLPDAPFSLRLDWTNPPLSAEASAEEQKKWAERRREETLGITSYSAVYSFLYIEEFEIRHEILAPLLTLEESVLVARDEDEFLDLGEQQLARPQFEAFFKSGNPIEVDGRRIEPVVQRCDFYGLDFRDFAQQADAKSVSLSSARVGIILRYPLEKPARQLKLTWDRFNKSLFAVNMVIFDRDDASRATLSRIGGKNEYVWENPHPATRRVLERVPAERPTKTDVELPVLAFGLFLAAPIGFMVLRRRPTAGWVFAVVFVLAGSFAWRLPFGRYSAPLGGPPPVAEAEAGEVFRQLHSNLYRAFDYPNESEIYDALSTSVDGQLLKDVYLEIRQGLEMQEQGGAVSRVRGVEIVEGKPLPKAADPAEPEAIQFVYQCRWNVAGTVEHWGHIHQRTNQYEAIFTVKSIDEVWKVTKMELLDEQRLQFETRLRKL